MAKVEIGPLQIEVAVSEAPIIGSAITSSPPDPVLAGPLFHQSWITGCYITVIQ